MHMKSLVCVLAILSFLVLACQSAQDKTAATVTFSQELETLDTLVTHDSISLDQKSELLGKIDERVHDRFIETKAPYASRAGMYLRKECYQAFQKMADHARSEGVELMIISAMRNFDSQKRIWEAKWNGERLVGGVRLDETIADPMTRALKILEYSSMPGSSRHHWGTDIDINALENGYFVSGRGLEEYTWLQAHAAEYGFCQPYTSKNDSDRTGYEEEKWHWTYMPISQEMTAQCAAHMANSDYKGFDGDEVSEEIDILANYVLGIHHSCR